jgi:hypothetical protein
MVGFRRDVTQPGGVFRKPDWSVDSRFGAQMSIKLDPSLFTTFQVISRYRYDGTYHPDLSEACVTWLPAPGLQLRGGLINIHETTTGEYLDAGYTYLWARPPVEAYGLTPITKLTGFDFLYDLHLGGDTTLETELYAGRTVEKAQIDHVGPFDLSGGNAGALSFKLITGPWKFRLVGATLKSGRNLPQPVPTIQDALTTFGTVLAAPELFKAADSLNTQGTTTWALVGSVVFENGPWQAQAYASSGSSSASLGYRIKDVVPYGMFSRIVSGRVPRLDMHSLYTAPGPLAPVAQFLAATVNSVTDGPGEDQYTLTAGLRWDFAPKADLKFQIENIRAHDATGLFYNPQPQVPFSWNGRMWVYTITMDFILGGAR